jgi:two-component system chemotaxis response regulator CheB
MRLKTLVVDDSRTYRNMIQQALASMPAVEIVGTAADGKIALIKAKSLRPDLITLDIEMPEMDGLEVLEHLQIELPEITAIVVSAYTTEGARITLQALESGALDFICKPASGTMDENIRLFRDTMLPIVDSLLRKKQHQAYGRNRRPFRVRTIPLSESAVRNPPEHFSRIIAIGVSTGGPAALTRVIPSLPPDIGVPVLVVQHMPPLFTGPMAARLDAISHIKVKEAVSGEMLLPGTVYLAPGGRHMKVESSFNGRPMIVRVTDDPPENNCRPSADYLFRSVADHFGKNATGVIMTGMGHDGTRGLQSMKEKGAWIIAQDESSCAVYGMPRKPIELGIVDVVAPLERIPQEICRSIHPAGSVIHGKNRSV